MHEILKKDTYLLVKLQGEATIIDFEQAIVEEMATDEYEDINDIWQLDDCIIELAYNELQEIVTYITLNYPENPSRTKTAIVASSGLSRALANFWAEAAKTLPYQVQIFMSLPEAENWIV